MPHPCPYPNVTHCTAPHRNDTEHRAASTGQRAPSTAHRAPSTEHRAPSTEHRTCVPRHVVVSELELLEHHPLVVAQRRGQRHHAWFSVRVSGFSGFPVFQFFGFSVGFGSFWFGSGLGLSFGYSDRVCVLCFVFCVLCFVFCVLWFVVCGLSLGLGLGLSG